MNSYLPTLQRNSKDGGEDSGGIVKFVQVRGGQLARYCRRADIDDAFEKFKNRIDIGF